MLVQTLVENAIKHGIGNLRNGGSIFIQSLMENEILRIEIINSGQLDNSVETTSGYGINNTIERLKLLFGSRATFELMNKNANEVAAIISITKT
jgi:LytS/YehU family sensor histidine kinase